MAKVRETRKIIVLPASPDDTGPEHRDTGPEHRDTVPEHHDTGPGGAPAPAPVSPDTSSDAESDDGPPMADTFFSLARENVGPALRYNVPIMTYAVAVAVPALSVYVPLTREVILPVASGNGTLASMSSVHRHGYLEAEGMVLYFQFLFMSLIVVSFIQGHPTTKRYSVIIYVVNFLISSLRTVVRHCGLLYSLNQGMVSLGLAAIFIVVQVPFNFGIVHIVLQKYAADSLWWHMPLCAFCFVMEAVNIVVIKESTSYLHSEFFQWTAPFVFSLTAMFTRRAAEWSAVPLLAAPQMSTMSLALAVFFTRVAQTAVLNDPQQFVILEVFYAVLNITLRVTLYSRTAISSYALSRRCIVRDVPRRPRTQGITTASLITESIFDTGFFIILFLSRFFLLPSSIATTNFILVFCGCIVVQILSNTATFVLVAYYEGIPIEAFSVWWTSFGDFGNRWIYHWVCTMFGLTYLNPIVLNVWDASIRIIVPWK